MASYLGIGANDPNHPLEVEGQVFISNVEQGSATNLVPFEVYSDYTGKSTLTDSRQLRLRVTPSSTTDTYHVDMGLDNVDGNVFFISNPVTGATSGQKIFEIGSDQHVRINTKEVNIGYLAGQTNQGTSSVAIGDEAGQSGQGIYSVAIGRQAGQETQGSDSVAIGYAAGELTQSSNAVAIGNLTGNAQGVSSVAIGDKAGYQLQGTSSVAIGNEAGQMNQGNNAVAIGYLAGNVSQSSESVAVGYAAGQTNHGISAVAIGFRAGKETQGAHSVAIGYEAGSDVQSFESVAIGFRAGKRNQGIYSVAIGNLAGSNSQSDLSVAIGDLAGSDSQGVAGVAIGSEAGRDSQGSYSVAIGSRAGVTDQHDNSIIINASGSELYSIYTNSTYIHPIRESDGPYTLKYSDSGEVTRYASSDRRMKRNLQLANYSAVDEISKLKVYTFEEKDNGIHPENAETVWTPSMGVISQELYKYAPTMRHTIHIPADVGDIDSFVPPEDPNDPTVDWSVWGTETAAIDHMKLVPHTMKAIQELNQEIINLKTRIAELENASTAGQ